MVLLAATKKGSLWPIERLLIVFGEVMRASAEIVCFSATANICMRGKAVPLVPVGNGGNLANSG